jgi:hypothetical protein
VQNGHACASYHNRGRVVCKNNLESPMETTDAAVLAAVEHDLLRVEVLETALAKALDMFQPATATAEAHENRIREELTRLEAEVGRLASAIAVGGDLSTLLAALQEREQRRGRLRTELATRQRAASRDGLDLHRVLEDLRGRLTDWQGLLRQETTHARQALRALLAGRLVFTPREESGERFYEFTGPATLGKVFAGLVLPTSVVTPAGFEPAISTLKGSRPRPG